MYSTDQSIAATPIQKKDAPKGIGMAVAFDWGLAVQMLVVPFLPVMLGKSATVNLVTAFGSIVSACLLAVFGEGIRRGWNWTRWIQIVANALGFLGGIFSLVSFILAGQSRSYWSLIAIVVLLIVSPLITWRLSQAETGRWFKTVTSLEARQRHGGMWPIYIAIWAIIGGILQALAITLR